MAEIEKMLLGFGQGILSTFPEYYYFATLTKRKSKTSGARGRIEKMRRKRRNTVSTRKFR